MIDGGDDVVVVKAKQNLRASPWRSTDLISRWFDPPTNSNS